MQTLPSLRTAALGMLLTVAMGMAVADRARAAPLAILYDGPDGVTCTHFN